MYLDPEKLSELLNGEWTVPPPPGWKFERVAISKPDLAPEKSNLFFALDKKKNNQKANFQKYENDLSALVAREKNETLSEQVPQLLVENTYEALKRLAEIVRKNYQGNVVAIKGPGVDSSIKHMLNHILSSYGNVVTTKGNHKAKADLPLTIVSGIDKPDYMILEIDISTDEIDASRLAEVSKPNITIINWVGDLKGKPPVEINRAINKMCAGIEPEGFVILNKEIDYFNKIKAKIIHSGAKVLTYGRSDDTDIYLIESIAKENGKSAKINIWEEEVEYDISSLEQEELLNSLAVIGAIWLLDLNIEEASEALKAYKATEH